MTAINSKQKKYLRGLAHSLTPAAYVGQKGLTENLVSEVETALTAHELVKVRFNDFKEREAKKEIIEAIAQQTRAEIVGMIGHMALLFRPQQDKEKQEIRLP